MDTYLPTGADNPLRQVIINTHSPVVVGQLPDDSLVYAATEPRKQGARRYSAATFQWLDETWRARSQPRVQTLSKGTLLIYLNPLGIQDVRLVRRRPGADERKTTRVIERRDLQTMLPLFSTNPKA